MKIIVAIVENANKMKNTMWIELNLSLKSSQNTLTTFALSLQNCHIWPNLYTYYDYTDKKKQDLLVSQPPFFLTS